MKYKYNSEMNKMPKDELINYCKELQMEIKKLLQDQRRPSPEEGIRIKLEMERDKVKILQRDLKKAERIYPKLLDVKLYAEGLTAAIRRANINNLNLNKEGNKNGI